jgi:hypothetical protein
LRIIYDIFAAEHDLSDQPWTHLEDSAIVAAQQLCEDKHFMLAEAILSIIDRQKNIRWSMGIGLGLMKGSNPNDTAAAALSALVSSSAEIADDSPTNIMRSARQIRDRYNVLRSSPRFPLMQSSQEVTSLVSAVRSCVTGLPGVSKLGTGIMSGEEECAFLCRAVMLRGQQSIQRLVQLSKSAAAIGGSSMINLPAVPSPSLMAPSSLPTPVVSALKQPAVIPCNLVTFAESAHNESLRRIPPQLPGLPLAPTNVLKSSGLSEPMGSVNAGNNVTMSLHPSHQQAAVSNKVVGSGPAEYDPLTVSTVILQQQQPYAMQQQSGAVGAGMDHSNTMPSYAQPHQQLPQHQQQQNNNQAGPTYPSPMITSMQTTPGMSGLPGPGTLAPGAPGSAGHGGYGHPGSGSKGGNSSLLSTPSPLLMGASPLLGGIVSHTHPTGGMGGGMPMGAGGVGSGVGVAGGGNSSAVSSGGIGGLPGRGGIPSFPMLPQAATSLVDNNSPNLTGQSNVSCCMSSE